MPTQIRKPLPFGLTFRPSGATANYQDQYNTYHFAIGGVPFLSATDNNNPLIRGSAKFKKDQIDQSQEPGEQTLTGWWLRSQSSFHFGSALKYEDPAGDQTAAFRFFESEGVNVWTLGEVSLLHTTANVVTGGTTGALCVGVTGSVNGVLYAYNNNLRLVDATGTPTTINYGSTNTIQSICTDGRNYFVSCVDGIYTGDLVAGGTGTKLWNYTATNTLVRWMKNRLMGALDNVIYELITPSTGSAPFALPSSPTYKHPNVNYLWNDMDEGPSAIYAIGYLGTDSSILKMTLDTTGLLPALTSATTVGQLPRSEIGWSLYGYLGSFMMIGTSKGIRVATITSAGLASYAGNLEYGPLIPTPRPVKDMVGKDHYVYAGFSGGMSDGSSGVIRVDLGQQLPSGKYAYTKDLSTHVTGEVVGVTTVGTTDRLAIATITNGLYFESATDLEPSGFLTTARIRYNTAWPKLFKKATLRGNFIGSATLSTLDQEGTETPIVTVGPDYDTGSDLDIAFPLAPQEYISLKIQLNRATTTTGPTFRSYQLKALPGGPRPRQLVVPLLCYDYEKDSDGSTLGYPGSAIERLQAVEALDSSGNIMLFEDLQNNQSLLVTIEDIQFKQMAPPGNNAENWGGVLTLNLRTTE